MILHFYLRYKTHLGQHIFISGNTEALGNDDFSKAFQMKYFNSEFWQVSIILEPDKGQNNIRYRYILREDGVQETVEFGNDRIIELSNFKNNDIVFIDTWNFTGEVLNVYFTQPFQNILLKQAVQNTSKKQATSFTHIFKVKAPILNDDEVICLIGDGNALNNWSTTNPKLLFKNDTWWQLNVDLSNQTFPFNYKYGVYNIKSKIFKHFEYGDNRILIRNIPKGTIAICHDGFANIDFKKWKGAGVAIPVFSLRSKNSFGTGEFNDLKLLVDWATKIGIKLIQVLPLNDTIATYTRKDSYPYAAISAFALHPLFLNLQTLVGINQAELIKPLSKKQAQLNALPDVDYEQVITFKIAAIKEIYLTQKNQFFKNKAYTTFFNANEHWLVPYAAFCFLRDKYKTSAFSEWKTNSSYNPSSIKNLVSPKQKHFDDVAVHFFTQFHLHLQLKEATEYAHQHGIVVKGDIPIGIYRNSVDAWMEPGLYNMNEQAGAPPDDFAIKGQNWGFPTYNWDVMNQTNFAWWQNRFMQMSNYFDAFRIDHILGFFRIWSIPLESVEGIMGKFSPAIPVYKYEFYEKNISFNIDRFCKPFINEEVLHQLFGEEINNVKETFLFNNELKEAFNTQQKVEGYFIKNKIDNDKIKYGLFNLISNIILFEEQNSGHEKFHFRIGMEQTLSFKNLDRYSQQALKELYVNYFFRRQDLFWKQEAMNKLPGLKRSTNMLICGEDLGMVPECVPDVMHQLGILSLEIQRMPKESTATFFHPNDAPYMSVVTPSTHDMSTIRGWWEEDRENTQRFYNTIMGRYGLAPYYCEPWINKEIVLQHLYSPAMWSIFQLQDLFGINEKLRRENPNDERINIPADPNHYWKYRMHIFLEDLLNKDDFNNEIKKYLADSGR